MEHSLQIFRTFSSKEAATELQNLLSDHNIQSESGDNIPSADVTFVNSTIHHQYEVRILLSDFERAEHILLEDIDVQSIDPSHYLFQFTDEELYDILLKPDEWNPLDYKLAQHILTTRGKTIDKALLTSLKNQRLADLAKPEENQMTWIIAGYIFAFGGGILGLVIGYLLRTSKKTLPNGERIYTYSLSDRKHGINILAIAIICTPFFFYYKFMEGI